MPLSEDEQRILREIEEQLHRDPNFARGITPTASSSKRTLTLGLVGGLVAIAVCVLLLAVSPYLAFAAFLVGVAAVALAARQLRSLGDEALRQMAAMRRQAGQQRNDRF
jgi:hypothetical protein